MMSASKKFDVSVQFTDFFVELIVFFTALTALLGQVGDFVLEPTIVACEVFDDLLASRNQSALDYRVQDFMELGVAVEIPAQQVSVRKRVLATLIRADAHSVWKRHLDRRDATAGTMKVSDPFGREERTLDVCERLDILPCDFEEVSVAVHRHEAHLFVGDFVTLLDLDCEDAVFVLLRVKRERGAVGSGGGTGWHRGAEKDEVARHPSWVCHLESDCDRSTVKDFRLEVFQYCRHCFLLASISTSVGQEVQAAPNERKPQQIYK